MSVLKLVGMVVMFFIALAIDIVVYGFMLSVLILLVVLLLAVTVASLAVWLILFLLPIALWLTGVAIGVGLIIVLGPLGVLAVPLGVMNGNDLIKAMVRILRGMAINPAASFIRQVSDDEEGFQAAYVHFMCTYEQFLAVRAAANAVGIWFASFRRTKAGLFWYYEVLVINESDRRK